MKQYETISSSIRYSVMIMNFRAVRLLRRLKPPRNAISIF